MVQTFFASVFPSDAARPVVTVASAEGSGFIILVFAFSLFILDRSDRGNKFTCLLILLEVLLEFLGIWDTITLHPLVIKG